MGHQGSTRVDAGCRLLSTDEREECCFWDIDSKYMCDIW